MTTITTTTVYHCTWTRHVSHILRDGLKPMQTSNWTKAQKPLGPRYGNGEVFAFTSKWDAIRWAAKMDWDASRPQRHGSGSVTILTVADEGQWELDEADPLTRLSYEGPWLKTMRYLPAEAITAAEILTMDMVKTFAKHQREAA